MFDLIMERIRQKKRTHPFPKTPVILPERVRGVPKLHLDRCQDHCDLCVKTCPTEAISFNKNISLDLGRCIFCLDCTQVCPGGVFEFTNNYQLATSTREDLILGPAELTLAKAMHAKILSLYGRSLKLRQVSAAGCNGCEVDTNVLNTLFFDLGRFGIQFVASPRHADGLLITGPVSKNMEIALTKTYDALPSPKMVIAVGACAISGGLFRTHSETHDGASSLVPVDLFIPGCPPHPMTILDGLLRFMNKLN